LLGDDRVFIGLLFKIGNILKFKKYLKRKRLIDTFNTKQQYSYAMGADGITTNKFGDIIDEEISIIKRKINNLTYNISPYREKLIIKNRDSKPRMISIPTNRDKLVLSALQKYIANKFSRKLFDTNVHRQIRSIKKIIATKKYDSFLKLDIKDFYPNIDHEILLNKVSKEVQDKKALYLLENALTQITVPSGRRFQQKEKEMKGVSQGLSISNVLASVYLRTFDKKYMKQKDIAYFRYVDDILILCNSDMIESIKTSILEDVKKLKLEAHEFKDNSDKSATGYIIKDKFQFLGFSFNDDIVSVRESSVNRLRDRILELFYTNKDANENKFYRELNLKITGCIYDGNQYGWMHFFGQMTDLTLLHQLDWYVKQTFKRFGRGYSETKIKKFTTTYFELKSLNIDKLNKNSYIPKFASKVPKDLHIIIFKLKDDVEFYGY
jgi:retron-type reverse transcriptase